MLHINAVDHTDVMMTLAGQGGISHHGQRLTVEFIKLSHGSRGHLVGVNPDKAVFFFCGIGLDCGPRRDMVLAGNILTLAITIKGPVVKKAAHLVAINATNAQVSSHVGAIGIQGPYLAIATAK